MCIALLLASLALREGLGLRRARRGLRGQRVSRRRHLRLAKAAVAMLVVGFLAGPLSAVLLRGWPAFGTAHAGLASLCLLLFLATAWLGRRLEAGERSVAELHARLAALAMLLAAAAFGAGFVLLP